MTISLATLLSIWLLPPLNALVLLIAGVATRRWRPRVGLWLLGGGITLLWLSAAPLAAVWTLQSLEMAPQRPLTGTGAGAIVILAGGTTVSAPEYGMDTVGPFTLERLRYGARLQRQTSLPILVTGGPAVGARTSEAEQMRDALQQDLSTQAMWVEPASMNTYENAVYSEKILREAGIRKILLVTHAWHMRRAKLAFEHAGLQVVPAPMGYTTSSQVPVVFALLPDARGMWMTAVAWHEVVGIAWYRIRFLFS